MLACKVGTGDTARKCSVKCDCSLFNNIYVPPFLYMYYMYITLMYMYLDFLLHTGNCKLFLNPHPPLHLPNVLVVYWYIANNIKPRRSSLIRVYSACFHDESSLECI